MIGNCCALEVKAGKRSFLRNKTVCLGEFSAKRCMTNGKRRRPRPQASRLHFTENARREGCRRDACGPGRRGSSTGGGLPGGGGCQTREIRAVFLLPRSNAENPQSTLITVILHSRSECLGAECLPLQDRRRERFRRVARAASRLQQRACAHRWSVRRDGRPWWNFRCETDDRHYVTPGCWRPRDSRHQRGLRSSSTASRCPPCARGRSNYAAPGSRRGPCGRRDGLSARPQQVLSPRLHPIHSCSTRIVA